jgi:hypothetical protein
MVLILKLDAIFPANEYTNNLRIRAAAANFLRQENAFWDHEISIIVTSISDRPNSVSSETPFK